MVKVRLKQIKTGTKKKNNNQQKSPRYGGFSVKKHYAILTGAALCAIIFIMIELVGKLFFLRCRQSINNVQVNQKR